MGAARCRPRSSWFAETVRHAWMQDLIVYGRLYLRILILRSNALHRERGADSCALALNGPVVDRWPGRFGRYGQKAPSPSVVPWAWTPGGWGTETKGVLAQICARLLRADLSLTLFLALSWGGWPMFAKGAWTICCQRCWSEVEDVPEGGWLGGGAAPPAPCAVAEGPPAGPDQGQERLGLRGLLAGHGVGSGRAGVNRPPCLPWLHLVGPQGRQGAGA
jgi:hypothetical protein